MSFLKSKYNLYYAPVSFLFLLIILFFRIYLNSYFQLPLHFDEAQYWSWAQNPEWGYFSKPPVLAWIISISNLFCGNSEFCIRLPNPILYFLSSIFIYLSTRVITKNNLLSCFSSLIFNLIPGITFSSFITTTDVPLILFASAFAYIFCIIFKENKPAWYYYILIGIFLSLGFLSKYAIAYFLISLFFGIFFFKDLRRKFLSFNGFIFILTFFIIILPHIYWNYENGFVTFNHTADNANVSSINLNLKEPLLFIFSQFIVFGIYPLYLILKKSIKFNSLNEEGKILIIFFLVPIIIISILSFFSRANANWAAVGFPFGVIFLSVIFNSGKELYKNYFLILSQLLLSLTIITVIFLGHHKILLDPFIKQKHIRELASSVRNELTRIENVAFMADDREDFALMLYYARDFKGRRAKWNGDIKIDDHFELTTNTNDLKGYNLLFLTRTAPTKEMIQRSSAVKLIKTLTFSKGKQNKLYNLYLLTSWN